MLGDDVAKQVESELPRIERAATHVNVNVADVRNVVVYGVKKRIAF